MNVGLHPEGARFVHLTTVGDANTARLLAARLAFEGIESRIHGDSLGPYPLTVGSLAETQIWVMSDRMSEASTLLLDAEVNVALFPVLRTGPAPAGLDIRWRVVALAVFATLAVLWALRLLTVY